MFRNLLSLVTLFFALSISFFAQESSGIPYTGYIEPKLKSVPQVNYPSEAFLTGIEGAVSVPVAISADGIVVEVKEPSGPGGVCDGVQRPDVVAMRSLAKKAAHDAVYEPAMIDDKPVQSAAVLVFNFVAPDSAKNSKGIPRDTAPIQGGILGGRAVSLPRPKYPAAAKAVRAEGPVGVQVIIDSDGKMFSATAISGHPLLRRTSEIAACSSKFAHTLVSGRPVKVSGIITYNFVP